jgi:RimJ/RimL family protein N-acetyltransferase
MRVIFTALQEQHIGLILGWLREPHVRAFWTESENEEEVRRKFLFGLRDRGVSPYIIALDGKPIGFIQSYEACKVGGGWWEGMPPGVFGIDQFIGDPALIGRGVGTVVISKFVEMLLANEAVREIIADPEPHNRRAVRAFEKAGFKSHGKIATPSGKALLMRYTVKE